MGPESGSKEEGNRCTYSAGQNLFTRGKEIIICTYISYLHLQSCKQFKGNEW